MGAFSAGSLVAAAALAIAGTPAQDLQRDLQAAADVRAASFVVKAAQYNFTQSLMLHNAANFDIHFDSNVALFFRFGSGVMLVNCVNVQLIGSAVIDYDPPTYAQGTVTNFSNHSRSFTYVDAEFDHSYPFPDWTLGSDLSSPCLFCAPYNKSTKVAFWDSSKRTMIRNSAAPDAINIYMTAAMQLAAANTYRINLHGNIKPISTGAMRAPRPGDLITVFPRGGAHALTLMNCSSVHVLGLKIYGGGSMGIVEGQGGGGHSYENIGITRRPGSSHLLSVNADGFHSNSAERGPTLVDSEIAFTGDDLANIAPRMLVVLTRLSEKSLVVIDPDQGREVAALESGDRLSFFHLNSAARLGEFVLRASEKVTDAATRKKALAAPSVMEGEPYDAHLQQSTFGTSTWRLDFDDALPANISDYWALAQCEPKGDVDALVARNHLHDGYARVFMAKASGMAMRGNRFERSGGVHVGFEQAWLEGALGLRDLDISDNVLVSCGSPAIAISPMALNVTGRNNTIEA